MNQRTAQQAVSLLVAIMLATPFISSGASATQKPLPVPTKALNVADRRAELERNLAAIEQQIDAQRLVLEEKQRQSVSLERDIAILNATIDKSKLVIRQMDYEVERLRGEIGSKESIIASLNRKIEREKASLAQLIRKTDEVDSYSFAEIVLSNQNLSDFFLDLDSYQSIKESLNASFSQISIAKQEQETAKETLESKVAEEVGLRRIQEIEKKRIEAQETEKKNILKKSRGQEAEYQRVIKENEKSASAIRSELFALRGSSAIPFERAYELAVKAGAKTGVRPALILGIVAEESNLGENVGTGNWRVDMKNPRDTVPFLDITKRLGLDPDKVPVSKKPWYGYGGAMGPAQFIPSTWVLYEDRITRITGHNPPNPWDPEDAFTASAILLMDNGAAKGTRYAERLAALRYLAGWANAQKSAYAFYGDDVMALADKYQAEIDILQRGS
jgi:membrane-bound lytic murein transglycosylase B